MSKDIRSYFQLKKPATKPAKSVTIDDDDDDVIPESPDVRIKNKKKESRKKRCISDSDEEIFETKKKKTEVEPSKSSHNKGSSKPALKEVKAADIFGRGPIKRTEPLVKKVKKNTELGIHSDEEFEKSLLEVDAEELAAIETKPDTSTTKQIDEIKESPSTHQSVEKEKSPRLQSEAKEKSSRNHSDKKEKSPSRHAEKTRKSPSRHDREKKERSPSKHEKKERHSEKTDKSPSKHHHEKKERSHSRHHSERKEKSPSRHHKDKKDKTPTKSHSSKDKSKDNSSDKSPHKPNGDSHSQELKSKDHKSNSKHSDAKEEKDKKHISPNKDRSAAISSVFSNKDNVKYDKNIMNEESSSKEKKRDFNEFLESDVSVIEDHDEKHQSKKKKLEKSLNESALTDEERHERRMYSAALYKNYLNRSGPKHLGAKEIPEGTPTCLANCAFLLTGVLDSFERDDIAAAISKFGGCVKNTMSKKVTHVLAGEDAGPAKMAKAQELGIKIIGEDEFLQMIKDLSKKPSSNKLDIKKETTKEKTPKKSSQDNIERKERKDKSLERKDKDKSSKDKDKKSSHEKSDLKVESKDHIRNKSQEKTSESKSKSSTKVNDEEPVEIKSEIKLDRESKSSSSVKPDIDATSLPSKALSAPSKMMSTPAVNSILWVEKYKPQNVKQIIGQHGDASNVKKLINWLTKWYVNRKAKLPKPSPWAKNDDGGYYKAALLSGPPGVGKTTSVALVCKELGFDAVEFNASDTRNKTLIREQIGELLTTTSLSAFARGDTGKQAVTKKHVLVMDEVDGMAGNEDRGGLQELIGLIKSTSVPIICMCNDRNSTKMRTLVNYCYDLRFNRPRVEQIKSAMMSICCKEGIKIPPDALTQLIVAANQDVRQTLNLMSMWAVDPNLTDSERLKKDAQSGKKDIKLGPWEAVRKVFSAEEHKTMSINDKSDLFFYDYSLAPLFVHENYLHVAPHCPKNEFLDRIAKAADSISAGDLIDARIRGSQAWGLLPMQAMYASVIPGHHLSGHVAGQINFPSWLGNNSKTNKMHRLCQEIHAHTRLSTSGSKSSIFLDYAPHLRDAIISPLLKDKSEGIEKSLEVLESYHLLREDLDSLTELSLWSGQRNPMILIDSKIKAAMTRTYNKKALALPYAPGAVKKGRAKDVDGEENDEEEPDEEQDSDPENDALIKKKKVKEEKPSTSKDMSGNCKPKAGSSKEKAGSSKDKPAGKRKK